MHFKARFAFSFEVIFWEPRQTMRPLKTRKTPRVFRKVYAPVSLKFWEISTDSHSIVTFPVTYLKVVLPRLPPLQSTVVAPQTKHVQNVQRVRIGSEALSFVVPLPDCPQVRAAFCAGLLHPEGADRIIFLPSIKYGLEVVLPTLAEIPKSQALLKELNIRSLTCSACGK